jgi:UDP-N-acetylglucosamine 4,6-dehydratase/UDP-glucose 4-epimerase
MGVIAITGATGYLAEGLIIKLLSEGHVINAIARNEGKLVALKDKYREINIFPCPIEDYCLLRKAVKNCDGIYHLASFKDVTLARENALKTVQTNILGSLNILRLTTEIKTIKFVLATSTDKAVKVSSTYGATKLILESLFYDFEQINGENCLYRIVRYGNVLYSTGSVLVKWRNALKNNQEIILTDPMATRFFISREHAIDIIYECLSESSSSTPFFPTNMKSVEIQLLLDAMIKKYSTEIPKIKIIGLQNGENKHEFIDIGISSEYAPRWSEEELFKIL